MPTILNEEQLLKDIAADPQKFGEVYHAFHNQIFGYVYRRTSDFEVARDITAESFLKAYAGIGKFRWRNITLLYWLYQIATNELNKYFNSRKYRPESLSRIEEEYGIDILDHSNEEAESFLLQNEMERHQEFIQMNAAVKKLDTKYGDVISLRFFEHKSIREIAIILDKKEGTVKSLLSRGLDQLKKTLKK